MSETSRADERVKARIERGDFLVNLLQVAATESGDVQEHFVRSVSEFSVRARQELASRGLILHRLYRPRDYWPAQHGKAFGFIDGGVANLELPTAAPIGVRVGSYVVRPGDTSPQREDFGYAVAIVDELFGRDAYLYAADDDDEGAEPFEDLMKLRDSARILAESAAALKLASRTANRPDILLTHGPLINPAAPYGLRNFPSLQLQAARDLLGQQDWDGDRKARGFIRVELGILERLRATGVSVAGVVERAKAGKSPFFSALIAWATKGLPAREALRSRDGDELLATAKTFGLNDTTIFDLVLHEGEYIQPLAVNRQGPETKWPQQDELAYWIGRYPQALTTFIKPSDTGSPFRIECFEGETAFDDIADLVLHTSRLLPSYVFPVGLDIVDRYSKVPAWMSAGVRARHQQLLLRKAFESGDRQVISYAKRVAASKGRDWMFRPTI